MRDSSNAFVKELFDQDFAERNGFCSEVRSKRSIKNGFKRRKKKGGSDVPTIANKFKTQLSNLTTQLDMCVPHYVCCVKPNARKLKYNEGIGAFEAIKSMRQLKYASVTVKIRQAGYPFRDTFSQFWSRAVMSRWHNLVVDPRTGATLPAEPGDSDDTKRYCMLLLCQVFETSLRPENYDTSTGPPSLQWMVGDTKVFGKDTLVRDIRAWQQVCDVKPESSLVFSQLQSA